MGGQLFKEVKMAAQKQGAASCEQSKCPACDKHGLPLLLTIPTLVDKKYAEKQPSSIKSLMGDLPSMSHAGYAMRTLREGYLMAYYETPPDSLAHEVGWTIAKVHKGGYMTPTNFVAEGVGEDGAPPLAASSWANQPFSCSRAGGYASALLFIIPEAKKAGKVWVAFSGHPWSPKVRKNFEGMGSQERAKSMTCVDATAVSSDASQPFSLEKLQENIIDYRDDFKSDYLKGNPFPLGGMVELESPVSSLFGLNITLDKRHETAADVLGAAKTALGTGMVSVTTNVEGLIVGLPDPEGLTATAAQRRITLCNQATDWLYALPDGQRRYQSSLTIKGLCKLLEKKAQSIDDVNSKRTATFGKKMQRAKFDKLKANGILPEKALFERNREQGRWMYRHEMDNRQQYGDMSDTVEFVVTEPGAEAGSQYDYGLVFPQPTPEDWGTVDYQGGVVIENNPAAAQQRIRESLTDTLTLAQMKQWGPNIDWSGYKPANPNNINWEEFLNALDYLHKQDRERLGIMQQDHKALLQSEGVKQLFTHQFDDTTRADGLPYACCVNACLLGGPITEDALAWWDDFLADDPTDKKNHLTRAMLGNQVDFFDWLSQPSQAATAWSAMPSIMNEDLLTRNFGASLRKVVAQSLVSNASSVAAFKAKAGLMNTTARQKFKKLVQAIGGQSEKGLQLYKLTVPSDVLGQLWKRMSADVQRAWPTSKKLGDYSIKSLVMPASTSMELTGAAGASSATVDFYIWSDRPLDIDDLSTAAKKGEYQITLAESKAAGAAPLVASINLDTAEKLVQKSMNVIKRSSSGILSAVAFFLQTQLVVEAWDELKKGTEKERQAAAYTLLSFGLGASAALMEIGEQALTLMKREVMANKLRFVAGIASALAAAVSAVQAAIAVVKYAAEGDTDALVVSVFQTIFFLTGAAFLLTGTFVSGTVSLMGVGLGLSWTGWGLVLVALGCVASLVVMFVKDKPLESWAAHTIWGDADEDEKYSNLQRAQSALNETLMGVSIDFECDREGWLGSDMEEAMQSTLLLSAATAPLAVAYAETNALANSWSWAVDVRATLPKSVKDEMAWVIQIYADKIGVGRQLVAQRSWKDIGTTFEPEQVYDEDIDGNPDLIRLVLSAKLDCNHYRKPVAIVRIASASQHEGDPDLLEGSVIVARRLSA